MTTDCVQGQRKTTSSPTEAQSTVEHFHHRACPAFIIKWSTAAHKVFRISHEYIMWLYHLPFTLVQRGITWTISIIPVWQWYKYAVCNNEWQYLSLRYADWNETNTWIKLEKSNTILCHRKITMFVTTRQIQSFLSPFQLCFDLYQLLRKYLALYLPDAPLCSPGSC